MAERANPTSPSSHLPHDGTKLTPDGLRFQTPNMLNLIVVERRTAHEEMVRHRCRGSRGCCSEGSYGCGSSQRLRSLPVLSSLNQRDSGLLGIRVARVFSLPWDFLSLPWDFLARGSGIPK